MVARLINDNYLPANEPLKGSSAVEIESSAMKIIQPKKKVKLSERTAVSQQLLLCSCDFLNWWLFVEVNNH